MNDKITNPFLKQLISEIATKATVGRMPGINWVDLNEAKKKKGLKKEAFAPKKKPAPAAPAEEEPVDAAPEAPEAPAEAPVGDEAPAGGGLPDLPDLGGGDESAPADAGGDEAPAEEPVPEASPEDAEEAQADASKAKAELEKAKAEKDKAEKEIKQQSYIKLGSHSGTQFLLGKLLDHAFKTNTIDALAGEMVQKLKIQTPEDLTAFGEETAPYRVLPGFPELLASMKTLATKQPDVAEEEPSA